MVTNERLMQELATNAGILAEIRQMLNADFDLLADLKVRVAALEEARR